MFVETTEVWHIDSTTAIFFFVMMMRSTGSSIQTLLATKIEVRNIKGQHDCGKTQPLRLGNKSLISKSAFKYCLAPPTRDRYACLTDIP